MRKLFCGLAIILVTFYASQHLRANGELKDDIPQQSINDVFFDIQIGVEREIQAALAYVQDHWQDSFLPFALDTLYVLKDPKLADQLVTILEQKTGQSFGADTFAWWQWVWSQPEMPHPQYGDFKSRLYGLIHFPFKQYFISSRKRNIRLDEVVWGGVRQDGIPPLRYPKMIDAIDADYLQDNNIVFGIAVGQDVRAYPKRILAWHEMFVDEVGGKSVAGVY